MAAAENRTATLWRRRRSLCSADSKNSGRAIGECGQRREWRVRLRLIPKGSGVKTVGAVVCRTVFDGDADRFFKRDGALDVPAIEAVAAADALGIDDVRRALMLIGEWLAAEVPCAVVVVLSAGAVYGGQRVAVNEDHIVAFAEPAVLILHDGVRDADEVALSGSFEKHVIVFAAEIFSVTHYALAGSGLAILRMEAAEIGGKAGECDVVDGEVEAAHALRTVIGDGDARRGCEGHLEICVERLDGSDGEQRRLIDEVFAEAEAEEVADGRFDGRG